MDWATLYPAHAVHAHSASEAASDSSPANEEEQRKRKAIAKDVEIADIGCGFGGLLFALAPKFPDTLILGTPTLKHRHFTPSAGLTHLQEWRSACQSQNTW